MQFRDILMAAARGGGAPDVDALAFIARLSPAPSDAGKAKIDTFVKAAKASGGWAKRIAIYVMGFDDPNWSNAEARTNAKLNWRQNAHNLTEAGTLTFVRGRGFKGDGSTGYLTTGFVPGVALNALFTQNNAQIEVWNLAEQTEDSAAFGCGPSSRTNMIQPARNTAGKEIVYGINTGAVNNSLTRPATSTGLTSSSRSDSANQSAWKDGVPAATAARVSAALSVTEPLTFLARGGTALFGTWEVAAGGFGADLTPTEQSTYARALQGLFGVVSPIHVIGDSFATNSFMRTLRKASGNVYQSFSVDGLGGRSLVGDADSFDLTPQYWDRTLVIMDGGLTDTSTEAITAINRMVARLTHNRWLYMYPSPQDTQTTGSASRILWDANVAAIVAAIGSDRAVPWLSLIQAASDGTANDIADVANGIPPRSLREDGQHLTQDTEARGDGKFGEQFNSGAAIAALQAKGWVA